MHGWHGVLSWARVQIKCDETPIQLLRARGGDRDAVVIAEITKDDERLIQEGRRVEVRRLMHGTA